jgi:hypothetical protein
VGAAAAGLAAVGAGLAYAVNKAADSQKVMAQTNAVIQSTGGAAGYTSQQINNMANAYANMVPFSDEAIQSTTNLLMTFTSIGHDALPQATKMALDMSVALGQDLKSSAIQLGKALNDPITGMTALRRVGVQFTEAQAAMIKKMQESGDLMGAQKVIMDELNKEFGGSAEAAGDTFAGQLEILQNALKNVAEEIGGKLLPILTDFWAKNKEAIFEFIDSMSGAMMGVIDFAQGLGDILGGAGIFNEHIMNAANMYLPGFKNAIMDAAQWTMHFSEALGYMANALASGNIQEILITLEDSLAHIGAVDLGAFVHSIEGPLMELPGSIKKALDDFNTLVLPKLQEIGGSIAKSFMDAFASESPQILANVNAFLQNIGPAISNILTILGPILEVAGKVLGQAIAGIVGIFSGLVASITQILAGNFKGALDTFLNTLTSFANSVSQAFGGVDFSQVLAEWGGILANAGTIITATVGNAVSAAQAWATSVLGALTAPLVNIVGDVVGYVNGAIDGVNGLIGAASAAGAALGQGLVDGAAKVAKGLIDALVSAVVAAIAAAKAAAQSWSPSKKTMAIGEDIGMGFVIGVNNLVGDMTASMGNAVNTMMKPAAAAPSLAAGIAPSLAGPSATGGVGGGAVFYITLPGVTNAAQMFDEIMREGAARGVKFAGVT